MTFLREAGAEPLPGYRLIEPLGSGGFGEVWKCEAPGGLHKAIKFVYGNLNSLDVEGARAEQELKALHNIKEVRHPFVVSLDRIEIVGGELVIVMELADKSLYDSFVECQAAGLVGIPRDQLLRYVRDAAEALDHMNERHNLQHLDVKPRNLFLVSDRVKVADFGLVKHLEKQSASGLLGAVTPLYAPPETFSGKISGRSDQYSLAIVYQELLTGQRPYNGKNARQLAQQHLQAEPDLRALPEAERPIVARALSKDPAKRFPNCLAFVRALYTEAGAARPRAAGKENGRGGSGYRPKTMADMMEDIGLRGAPNKGGEPADEVDLGGDSPADGGGPGSISKLGMTVAQPETGALRPTLVIGLGHFGRRALLELRCRFLDRFGDLAKLPLLRFLYIDADPDSVRTATRGTPDIAFKPGEVYPLPLQPVNHYRRRQLEQLCDWLPREKLYTIPRSLKTQGSRALGRLAFTTNYLRFLTRLRREVQQAAHPDTLYQAVSQTGLALRDSVPRVYVIAAAGGGSSGFLVDLGYSLRRLLQQLRQPEGQITAFLFCGAVEDPAMLKEEQSNIYATLTELNHFHDPSIPFTAQYGAEGPQIVDNGPAFDCTYLLTAANRTPEARRDAVAHLGSYLFHELTTPLGIQLERTRQHRESGGGTPFRSFGTHAIWFPRGLLLRLAAGRACAKVLGEWQAPGEATARAEVEAACARTLTDPGLRPESLATRIEQAAGAFLEGTPGEVLTTMLTNLEEQSQQFIAQDDPASWSRQALSRVQEWLGFGLGTGRESAGFTSDWRKSRLTRALEGAAQKVADEWAAQLTEVAFSLMEHPGRRLATAEAALERLREHCREVIAGHNQRRQQQATRVEQAQKHLEDALASCLNGGGGGWGLPNLLFGGRPRRQLRVFVDHLAAFARQCLTEDLAGAVQQFFVCLSGKIGEALNDLAFCRQRLRDLQQSLEEGDLTDNGYLENGHAEDLALTPSPVPTAESFWEAIQDSPTARVVLPDGEADLERAAFRFVQSLPGELWPALDQALQDKVLGPLGGLQRACTGASDLAKTLARPLVEEAAQLLGSHLPITDVAQAESSAARSEEDFAAKVRDYHARAEPLVTTGSEADQNSFILIPASPAGKAFGDKAKELLPQLQVVRVAGQADLMFCREQGYFRNETVLNLLQSVRASYEEAVVVTQASPHARFDISDWVPLDP